MSDTALLAELADLGMRPAIVNPATLLAWPGNYNTHPAAQLAALGASLNAAWKQPKNIVTWHGYIVCGHGLVQAALQQGKDRIIINDISHLSEADAVALLIADNALPALSVPDLPKLDTLLGTIPDYAVPGVSEGWLDDLRSQVAHLIPDAPEIVAPPVPDFTEPDAAPPAPTVIRPGDLMEFAGGHRLLCGDCRAAETLPRLVAGRTVAGVFTSPPYAEQRKTSYGGIPAAEYVTWWEAVQANVQRVLAADGSFFVNIKAHAEQYQRSLYVWDLVLAMARTWGWQVVDEFAWIRPGIPGDPHSMGRFRNRWESVYHFARAWPGAFYPEAVKVVSSQAFLDDHYAGGATTNQGLRGEHRTIMFGDRQMGHGLAYPGNVLDINTDHESYGHPAAFPVALPAWFMRAYSRPGAAWLDPFGGSGSTLVAAIKQDRIGYAVEMLPEYVQMTIERVLAVQESASLTINGERVTWAEYVAATAVPS